MYLQKLDIVGFKSFADKSELDFLPPASDSQGMTAVVGPNGSGKSNVADALRWVLGEQSAKLLRGKKAEDVIFSGSEKRARSGFAEVSLLLNNEDGKVAIDFSQVELSRRIYRDGESEYLINKNKVRLADVQLLLAQASFGARSYAVIGQGMVDNILVASPQERKEFFDEAAGVRQYQLKRQQSVLKLDAARENLAQAELLMAEIEPRLRSLSRQVKRLEERGALEEELHALSHEYYGKLWTGLMAQLPARREALAKLEAEWQAKDDVRQSADAELAKLEVEETDRDAYTKLQTAYEQVVEERSRLREREMRVRGKLEVAQEVERRTAGALPLSKIIEEIASIGRRQDELLAKLRAANTPEAVAELVPFFEKLTADTRSLRDRLERPPQEKTEKPREQDPALVAELAAIAAENAALTERLKAAQTSLQTFTAAEHKKKEKFFTLQRTLQDKISAAHGMERRLNDERIEIARLDTRRESLEQEMATELGERVSRIKEGFAAGSEETPEAIAPRLQKIKYQLQLIGGIDPEAVREHEETRTRHEFLDRQVSDLRQAIADLDRVIDELDATIKTRSEAAFRNLNRDFDKYFKRLFGGGHAELIQIEAAEEAEEAEGDESVRNLAAPGVPAEAGTQNTINTSKISHKKAELTEPAPIPERRDRIVGIDIHAVPPGKKIKNIAMLSGGERSLVSIALICAIMVNNPSPFVVLDEVDAALDESNAAKFAAILDELAVKTQFIVITHNRYTMRQANVLYGVTMRQDGTSMLLSVNLDEADNLKNAAREKERAKVTV